MADYFGAASDLLGGIGGFFAGRASASGAKASAQSYAQAAQITLAETALKDTMVQRKIFQVLGGQRADVAASGLKASGSVLDVIRDSAQQGAITKALVDLQGRMDYNNYKGMEQAARAQASGGLFGGILGGIAKLAGAAGALALSDDILKEDITLVRRRGDGIGVYHFRYAGTPKVFEGVMASEVEKIKPSAVFHDEYTGLRMVDYGQIGVEFKEAA